MRKTLRASILMLALCGAAFAGDIPNPSNPQSPPPRMTTEEETTDAELRNEAADSLVETVLSVFEGVLALF